MRPTRASVLAALVVVPAVLVVAYVLVLTPVLPVVPRSLPVVLAVAALGMLAATLAFRRRLSGAPGAKPYDPLQAARMVVLAKACAHGGAVLAGGYTGLTIALLVRSSSAARRSDALVAGLGALAALGLMAVGLFLEHACRVPPADGGPQDRSRLSSTP